MGEIFVINEHLFISGVDRSCYSSFLVIFFYDEELSFRKKWIDGRRRKTLWNSIEERSLLIISAVSRTNHVDNLY